MEHSRIIRFLRWFCPPHLLEEIEGDLLQKFEKDVKVFGDGKAKRRLLLSVVSFCRPGIILRNKISQRSSGGLIINHIRFATRHFIKDKFFATLNVLGLALSIAIGILLLLILQNDLTYDQHHKNNARIYRLGARQQMTGDDFSGAITARELGPALQEEFPEIDQVVRVEVWGRTLVKIPENENGGTFFEENIIRADSSFFHVFTHFFLAGNPITCLLDPNAVVLTQTMAQKYFGESDPINKTILLENSLKIVTAVIEDIPSNSHLRFGMLLSHLPEREFQEQSEAFWNPDVYTYLLVTRDFDPKKVYDKFPAFYNRHLKFTGDRVGGTYTPILEPLTDIHFNSGLQADLPQGNLAYLYALTGIGILIILLACINYMNLSTAKASVRAGEIAIRKTLGSSRLSLTVSFFTESIFVSLISFGVAIVLVQIVLHATPFLKTIDKTLSLDLFDSPIILLGAFAIALGIGFLSGLYPAIILPAIPTIKVLKGNFKNSQQGSLLRKVSTGIQFIISIFAIACVLFMQDQIKFVSRQDLGFDRENILVLPLQDSVVQKQITTLRNEFRMHPVVISVTTSQSVIGMEQTLEKWVMWAEGETGMKMQGFRVFFVGADYVKTMGIELLDGRDFAQEENSQTNLFLANETAAKVMGWNNAVGKRVKFYQEKEDGQIIGLVKDFNANSLHNPMEPTLICRIPQEMGFLQLKIKGNPHEIIGYARDRWNETGGIYPFEYFFLDDRFDDQYKADVQQGKLLTSLSMICTFISILGLIGLAAFQATKRIKEIGIRKVLGANVSQVIVLLSTEAFLLLLFAIVVAIPLTQLTITYWLKSFAYRMDPDYLIFVWITLVAGSVVFLIVLIQSLKAAQTNPAKTLKYE